MLNNGYWFILCAGIESAWERCEEKLYKGELEHLAAEYKDNAVLGHTEDDERTKK